MNEELLAKAVEIRDETKENQNSATRIGRLFIDVINKLSPGYGYMGMATPSDSPAQTTQKCFYQASSPGTYVNFGALVVKEGEIAYLLWDGISWRRETYFDIVNDLITGGADKALSAEMGKELNKKISGRKEEIVFTNGYIDTAVGVGSVVDITPISSSSGTRYAIIDISDSIDIEIVYGKGGVDARLWAFIDETNTLLSVASPDDTVTGKRLNVPDNATKCIINFKNSNPSGVAYAIDKSNSITAEIEKIRDEQNDRLRDVNNLKTMLFGAYKDLSSYNEFTQGGYVLSDGSVNTDGASTVATDYIYCKGYDVLLTIMPVFTSSKVKQHLAFYDEEKNFISAIGRPIGDEQGAKIVAVATPENACYVRTTYYKESFWEAYGNFLLILGTSLRKELLDLNFIESYIDDNVQELLSGTIDFTLEVSMYTNLYAINYNNGSTESSSAFTRSGYVGVDLYKSIRFKNPTRTTTSGVFGMAFYDESKNYISGNPLVYGADEEGYEYSTVDVPANAKYARFTWYADTTLYGELEVVGIGSLSRLESRVKAIEDELTIEDSSLELPMYDNLFAINYNNGSTESSSAFTRSGYVGVDLYKSIRFKNPTRTTTSGVFGMAFYDESKNYISGNPLVYGADEEGYEYSTVDVPANAKYARFTWYADTTLYGELEVVGIGSLKSFLSKPASSTGVLIGGPDIKMFESIEHNAISEDLDSLYSRYDALVEQYPQYIQRLDDIGVDSSGEPIRHYRIAISPVCNSTEGSLDNNEWASKYDFRKIIISAGTHGDEKSSIWGVLMFCEEIVSSVEKWALFFKGNYQIHILPCNNPWGYRNGSRNNYNGVNINRDFLDMSQSETAAIAGAIDSISPLIAIDSHNTTKRLCYFEVLPSEVNFVKYTQMTAQLASVFMQNWDDVYNNNSLRPYLYMVKSSHNGTFSWYVNSKGILGHTIETPRDMNTGGNANFYSSCKLTMDILANIIPGYTSI